MWRSEPTPGLPGPLALSTLSPDLSLTTLPLHVMCWPPVATSAAPPPWCTTGGWVAVITPVYAQPRLVDADAGAPPGTPQDEPGLAMRYVLGEPRVLRLPGALCTARKCAPSASATSSATRSRTRTSTRTKSRSISRKPKY